MNLDALFRSITGSRTYSNKPVIELKTGQLVKGMLLEMLSDQEALLRLNGAIVRAQLNASIRPGQETWFQVHSSSRAERIVLQAVSLSSSQVDQEKAILDALGVKGTETNKKLITSLLDHRLPLSKDTISSLQQTLRYLPDWPEEIAVQAGVSLLKKTISPTPVMARSVAEVILFPQRWNELLMTLREGFAQWADLSGKGGIQHDFIRQWEAVYQGSAGSAENVLPKLKQFLLSLLHARESDGIPSAIKETVRQLLTHMAGHQIMSQPEPHTPQAMVQIPFATAERSAAVYIKSRKGKGEPLSAENCLLHFLLSMKHLGETELSVQIHNKIMNITIQCDHPEMEPVLKNEFDALKDSMSRLGYKVNALHAGPLPVKNATEQTAGDSSPAVTIPYKGVDVRI